MTVEEVQQLVNLQAETSLALTNDHSITLKEALVSPQKMVLIARTVSNGEITDERIDAWLVGRESTDGYKIVMSDDGKQFGLASEGFPNDRHPILVGWYGDLISAFLGM